MPTTEQLLLQHVTRATEALSSSAHFGVADREAAVTLNGALADLVDELAIQAAARRVPASETRAMVAAASALRGWRPPATPNLPCSCEHPLADHADFGCARDVPGGADTCPCAHMTGYTFTQSRHHVEEIVGLRKPRETSEEF